jgi:hypothetical protein
LPEFDIEIVNDGACQAVIPARQEIPDQLQLTVSEVLQALKKF